MKYRNDKRGRRGYVEPFVLLRHWILRSPAFSALSPNAKAAYINFRLFYNGSNNGKIAMSARSMGTWLKKDKSTGSRAIAELVVSGFIVCERVSAFNMKQKLAAEYRLTEEVCNLTNRKATKDFMLQKPVTENSKHGRTGALQGVAVAPVSN